MEYKRAQAWGFDLIIGLMIFLFGILFFYLYTINTPLSENDEFESLRQEAAQAADSLMSEGSPVDWDASSVVRIGLLSDGRIDETKWAELKTMDYQRARSLFRITNNFFIYFDSDEANGFGRDYSSAENVVKVTRIVIRNVNTTTLNVIAWK